MITATNKHTGEIIQLPVNTPEEVVRAWQIAQEYGKTAETLKTQLKSLVTKFVEDNGTSEPINGFMFRVSNVQRMNYDKVIMREALDEDTLDLFLVPDKPKFDKYIKEHLDELGETSSLLRKTMVSVGKPYTIVRLERVDGKTYA